MNYLWVMACQKQPWHQHGVSGLTRTPSLHQTLEAYQEEASGGLSGWLQGQVSLSLQRNSIRFTKSRSKSPQGAQCWGTQEVTEERDICAKEKASLACQACTQGPQAIPLNSGFETNSKLLLYPDFPVINKFCVKICPAQINLFKEKESKFKLTHCSK